jgi:predicted amidohydrolase
MKVAAVQFAPSFREKGKNLMGLTKLVLEASKKGAQLVVLPELATTGYTYMSKAQAEQDAEVVGHGLTTAWMLRLAKRLNVHLVCGMVERDHGTGDLYNPQVYVEPSGYYTSFRKLNRWGNDFLWAKAGKSNPPVIKADGLNGRRIGLLICRDIRNKVNDDWKNLYSKGDADIVCLSTNWGDGGFPAVSWMDFVQDHNLSLIVANRYGQEGPNDFGEGGSCIIKKNGDVMCEGLLWSKDCIILGDL